MVEPWRRAGYDCWIVDLQHDGSAAPQLDHLTRVAADLSKPYPCPVDPASVAFVAAFPPCDHLAVSGSRWFRGKGLRALSRSIDLFATAAEFCDEVGAPYLIENPISTISSYWRKPDHIFHPCDYSGHCSSDTYYKKTCLWVGCGFQMPPIFSVGGDPDDRIHRAAPRPDRKNFRSKTPEGFSQAVYLSNRESWVFS